MYLVIFILSAMSFAIGYLMSELNHYKSPEQPEPEKVPENTPAPSNQVLYGKDGKRYLYRPNSKSGKGWTA